MDVLGIGRALLEPEECSFSIAKSPEIEMAVHPFQQAAQFALDFLPPCSPELNPIERVWKLTRRLCFHNRYFGFLDSVVDAVETQFVDWARPNEVLRSLCAII
jgi:hypothetical protein